MPNSTSNSPIEQFAADIGQFCPQIVFIERGYYWDVVNETIIPGNTATGDPPHVCRNQKRAMRRKLHLAQEMEDKFWTGLSTNIKLTIDYMEQKARERDDNGDIPVEVLRAQENIQSLWKTNYLSNLMPRFIIWVIRKTAEEMLESNELREQYLVEPTAFTRERAITLADIVMFSMAMAGSNLNNEVYEYFKMNGLHPSPEAMIQRRKALKSEGMEFFCKRITSVCQALTANMPATDEFATFHSILAADGSDINLVTNPNDEATYIKNKEGRKGWNQYHLNAIIDVRTQMFVNALLQPKPKLHETRAASTMIQSMSFKSRTLFLGDRGYSCLNLFETIRRKENLECVIRVKDGWIKETKELPMEDLDVNITVKVITTQRYQDKQRIKAGLVKYLSGASKFGKNKSSQVWDFESEVDVVIRIVRFKLSSGQWETLATTLPREEFTVNDLKKLYFMRWKGIENAFRILKWDNHLAQIHSKLDNSARQEIFARLAMFNVVSCVCNAANYMEAHDESKKSEIKSDTDTTTTDGNNALESPAKRKHNQIINRHFATHLVCDFFRNKGAINVDVMETILRFKSPVRPGRSFVRNMHPIGCTPFIYR